MDFFFYGTLRDAEVRSRVLARRLPERCIEEAELDGFRPVFVKGKSYPMVVPGENARTPGLLVRGLGPHDAARLNAFEGVGYQTRTLSVTGERSGAVAARVFVPRAGVAGTDAEWTLESWSGRFRARFLSVRPFRPS